MIKSCVVYIKLGVFYIKSLVFCIKPFVIYINSFAFVVICCVSLILNALEWLLGRNNVYACASRLRSLVSGWYKHCKFV